MSANNWTNCPRCIAVAARAHKAAIAEAESSYGKVSAERYLELLKVASRPVEHGLTLREDYGLGVCEDGVFRVTYDCRCGVCAFEFSYKYTEVALVSAWMPPP